MGSGKNLKRPGIRTALDMLAAGEASALVVAKLDRLSRSMLDFARIMATAQTQSWAAVSARRDAGRVCAAGSHLAQWRSGQVFASAAVAS